MEIINWLEYEEKDRWNSPNLVAYALIEAMSEKDNHLDVFKIDGNFNPKALEIEFKVNGIEVSFVGVMERIQKAISSIEKECRETLHKDAAKDIIELLQDKYRTWEQ